jgi:hypothetical protein
MEADGLRLGLADAEGEIDADGDIDGLLDAEGEMLGLTPGSSFSTTTARPPS